MTGLVVFLVVAVVAIAMVTMVAERRRNSEYRQALNDLRETRKFIKEEKKDA